MDTVRTIQVKGSASAAKPTGRAPERLGEGSNEALCRPVARVRGNPPNGHPRTCDLPRSALEEKAPPECARRLTHRRGDEPVEVVPAQTYPGGNACAIDFLVEAPDDEIDELAESVALRGGSIHATIVCTNRGYELTDLAELQDP